MALARVTSNLERQIELSIDPEKARALLSTTHKNNCCAICGEECAVWVAAKYFGIALPIT